MPHLYMPGMDIIPSEQTIRGSVSKSFCQGNHMTNKVPERWLQNWWQMQKNSLLAAASQQHCNAVLNIPFNVTNDSSDQTGQYQISHCYLIVVCLVVFLNLLLLWKPQQQLFFLWGDSRWSDSYIFLNSWYIFWQANITKKKYIYIYSQQPNNDNQQLTIMRYSKIKYRTK